MKQFEEFGFTLVYTPETMAWRRDVDEGAEAHVLIAPRRGQYRVTLHWGEGAVSAPVDCDEVIEAVEAAQKFHLAILFSTLLVEEYGADDMSKVILLNQQDEFAATGTCGSREIGEADRIMAEAWEKTFKSAMDPMRDRERDMWSGAWELAKAAVFYTSVSLTRVIDDDAYIQMLQGDTIEEVSKSSYRNHWFVTVHWDSHKQGYIVPFRCETIDQAELVAEYLQLAFTFSRLVKKDLGPKKLAKLIKLSLPGEGNLSHFFCDTDKLMDDAFYNTFGVRLNVFNSAHRDHLEKALWMAHEAKFYTTSNIKARAA